MLDSANLRFAKQAGATHIVAHMPGDVSERNTQLLAGYGERAGHGLAAGADDPLWSYEGLRDLRAAGRGRRAWRWRRWRIFARALVRRAARRPAQGRSS